MAYFKCKGEAGKNIEYLYKWDFTKSLTDEIQGVTATLEWNASQDSTGVHFSHYLDAMNMSPNPINMNGKTIEIDIASFVFAGDNSKHVRFIMNASGNTAGIIGTGMLIRRSTNLKWNTYLPNSQATSYSWGDSWNIQDSDLNGHTLKMSCEDGNKLSMWIDDQLVDTKQGDYTYLSSPECDYLRIGGFSYLVSDGDQCYNMTITGIRIYNNPKPKPKPKPKKLLIADWEFNKELESLPWIDEINGYELSYDNSYNYTLSETPPIYRAWIQREGSNNMHYLKLPNSLVFNPNEHDSIQYVIDINHATGIYTLSTTFYRLFVLSDDWGNPNDRMIGLIWRSTGYSNGNWYLYVGLTDTYVYISDDENFFNESIITVELKKNDNLSTLMTVYRNGIEVASASIPLTTFGDIYSLSFGSFRNSINATINGLKVYANNN